MRKRACLSIALAASLAAIAAPLSWPGYIPSIAVAAVSFVFAAPSRRQAWIAAGIGIGMCVLALGWTISPPVLTALAASAIITANHPEQRGYAAALLLPTFSYVPTIQALGANVLSTYSPGSIASFIVVIAILLIVALPRLWGSWLCAAALGVIVLAIATRTGFGPTSSHLIAATPLIATMGIVAFFRPVRTLGAAIPFALLLAATWTIDPPRDPTDRVLLLPTAPEAYEAQFYRANAAAWNAVGIQVRVAEDLADIPNGALVILPWTTADFLPKNELGTFASRARQGGWTVLAAGEHTNYGGVADRLNAFGASLAIADNTTVPPGNTDLALHTRGAGLIPFPWRGVLNRGASIEVSNWRTRIVLVGDGWFAEPPPPDHSPFWLGDFRLDGSEQRGLLVLAAVAQDNNARWFFIGDTGPFLDQNVVADPSGLRWIIAHASGWPSFIADAAVLLALVILTCYGIVTTGVGKSTLAIVKCCGALSAAFVTTTVIGAPPDQWARSSLGEAESAASNFNRAQVELLAKFNPTPFDIVRHNRSLEVDDFESSSGRMEVHFGFIDHMLRIGDAIISDCRRIGDLSDASVRLMDAQACAVRGKGVRILLGDTDGAAAFAVRLNATNFIVVLDREFLANRGPYSLNLQWLVDRAIDISGGA